MDVSNYDELEVELKMLYTIVTRAKCTLIIYDQNLPQEFEYIWKDKKLIYMREHLENVKEAQIEYHEQVEKEVLSNVSWR